MRFPSPAPFPQIFYGPQVDRLKNKGVGHWLDFQKRHGFHGILIPCANLPLNSTGIRALVKRNPGWTLVRLFGDEQSGQVPDGGLLGAEAMSYYRMLYRLLGEFGPEKWGVTVGFDPFEWTTFEELSEWVSLLTDVLDPFGDERMIGARARTRGDEPPNSKPNPGTYAPWAVRVIDKSDFRSQIQEIVGDSGVLPAMAEDGFRKRPGGRSKDWTEAQMIGGNDFDGGFEVAMEEGVGATWGNFSDEGGEDGCIDWINVDAVREILSPGNGNGNGEPDDCCVLACESGEKIREIREALEQSVVALRAVESVLLGTCDMESPEDLGNPENPEETEGPEDLVEPKLTILEPGTKRVESWPIVQRPKVRAFVRDGEMVLKYDRLTPLHFPEFMTLGEMHHGNAWMIFKDFSARPMEWLRRERERNETAFPLDEDVPFELNDGDLVGVFFAGPSRHMNNEPRFRQRTNYSWFVYKSDGELEPTEAP